MVKIQEDSEVAVINLALDTINKGKQALVFVNTKRSAEKTAEEISKKLKSAANDLANEVLHALARPTVQCRRLANCVEKGIAFHHAGLVQKQREIVEDSFREGKIKIICCTPTLALGVDLPAFRAIIRDLKRYGHRGMEYIPVLEYHQMAGRAGRPRYDKFGEAICIASSESMKEEITERFVNGQPEDIYSKLAVEPVLRTYLLSLIAADFVGDRKEIVDFFSKTFWAFQFKDIGRLEEIIDKMLALLDEWEFISMEEEGFTSADRIDSGIIKATILGKRVAELYIDPLTAYHFIECLRRSANKELKPFSFLQAVSNTLEMRPLLRVRAKEYEIIEEALVKYSSSLLEDEPSMYDMEYKEFINSVKTALFMEDWMEEKSEEELLEKYDVRPGEIRVKLDNGDWLLYSMYELCRILKIQPLLKEIMKTRLRLKNGVKEELLGLLRLKNIGRVRARRLFNNRIKTVEDVKKADLGKLKAILGENVAADVKEQVGEKVEIVKSNKRKGQISLKDY